MTNHWQEADLKAFNEWYARLTLVEQEAYEKMKGQLESIWERANEELDGKLREEKCNPGT